MTMSIKWSELIMKSSVPAVVAGIMAIYDLVVEVLITDSLNGDISFSRSFFQLGSGLNVGLSGRQPALLSALWGTQGTAWKPGCLWACS